MVDLSPRMSTFVSNLLLSQNLVPARNLLLPLWSLPIEVQMYLFLPLIAWVMRRHGVTAMATLWTVSVVVATLIVLREQNSRRLAMLLFAPCFIAGASAYFVSRDVSPKFSPRVGIIALLLAIALFSLTPVHLTGWYALLNRFREWLFTGSLAAGIVLMRNSDATRLTDAAHVLAKYSYGLYLVHVPVLAMAIRAVPDDTSPRFWMLVLVSLSVLSWGAYHFIEEPGIRLGLRIARGTATRAAFAPAP